MNFAGCTIVSKNYFAYAKTLESSFKTLHPANDFFILIVDKKEMQFAEKNKAYNLVWVEDLGIKDFDHYAFKYDILELNTNVKPSFLKRLLKDYPAAFYIDPDIFFYQPLHVLAKRFDQSSIIVTPHTCSPIQDSLKPQETDFLKAGVFNLGFIGVKADQNGFAMLDWWESRCLHGAFNDPAAGVFVDQKWIDLVPCLFDGVFIEKSPSYNMAYWNLHERQLSYVGDTPVVNTQPLVFFHFSGVDFHSQTQISKYQNRYDLNSRNDLKNLFSVYRAKVLNFGHDEYKKYTYSYAKFESGEVISGVLRRLYACNSFVGNPFAGNSEAFQFAKRNNLIQKNTTAASFNSYNTNHDDKRLRLIRAILKGVLKCFGVEKYSLLLKYMAYIANPRNQKDMFK